MTIQIPQAETISISELKVDGENPNRMTDKQLERLKSSIEKYGFIVPIITNKDLLIADGEQRLTVARQLGMKQVSVVRLPVEDVDRRLLRQVLNKLRGEHELIADALEFERIIGAGHEDELKHLLDLQDEQLTALRYITDKSPDFDAYAEWVGMPEFIVNDSNRMIIVHFKSEKDVQDFAKLVKQNITEKTKYIWYPQQIDEKIDLRYVSES